MSVEKCGNCAFGVKHYGHQSYDLRCHRHSPIFKPEGDAYGRQTLWPIVKDDDFCGDWELTDARDSITERLPDNSETLSK